MSGVPELLAQPKWPCNGAKYYKSRRFAKEGPATTKSAVATLVPDEPIVPMYSNGCGLATPNP